MDAGHVMIGDFGISKLLEGSDTAANTFIGSPYWMAPEVILAMETGMQCRIQRFDALHQDNERRICLHLLILYTCMLQKFVVAIVVCNNAVAEAKAKSVR